jgi:hypothetical protein
MTDRSTLLELAERCEKATGPDRDIDGWIWAHLKVGEPYIVGQEPGRFPQKPIYGERLDVMRDIPGKDGADYIGAPAYTASLDAAMSLAMPHWWWSASAPLSEAAYGWSREDQRQPRAGFEMIGEPYSVGARAATVPLAICAAALKARANQPEDKSQ